ncbi:MAG: flagellar biosynthesis protein FliZ [Clostridiaceae bacterium]|jgi:flagellar protein FliO/FliZ|nr:flagellar biosynthesis protein FliZ [Clostridiaceae bacterium]
MEFFSMLLKIIVFLPFVIFLIYLSLKFGGSKLQQMQNGKYIKVLERVPLSKESNLVVVKIGDTAYVISTTLNKVEILKTISQEELLKLEQANTIPEFSSLKEFYENTGLNKWSLSNLIKKRRE